MHARPSTELTERPNGGTKLSFVRITADPQHVTVRTASRAVAKGLTQRPAASLASAVVEERPAQPSLASAVVEEQPAQPFAAH